MPQDCSASVSQLQSSCGRAYGTALANHASSVMLAGLGAAASLREGGRMMKSASTQGALGHNHTRVNAENKQWRRDSRRWVADSQHHYEN